MELRQEEAIGLRLCGGGWDLKARYVEDRGLRRWWGCDGSMTGLWCHYCHVVRQDI